MRDCKNGIKTVQQREWRDSFGCAIEILGQGETRTGEAKRDSFRAILRRRTPPQALARGGALVDEVSGGGGAGAFMLAKDEKGGSGFCGGAGG